MCRTNDTIHLSQGFWRVLQASPATDKKTSDVQLFAHYWYNGPKVLDALTHFILVYLPIKHCGWHFHFCPGCNVTQFVAAWANIEKNTVQTQRQATLQQQCALMVSNVIGLSSWPLGWRAVVSNGNLLRHSEALWEGVLWQVQESKPHYVVKYSRTKKKKSVKTVFGYMTASFNFALWMGNKQNNSC